MNWLWKIIYPVFFTKNKLLVVNACHCSYQTPTAQKRNALSSAMARQCLNNRFEWCDYIFICFAHRWSNRSRLARCGHFFYITTEQLSRRKKEKKKHNKGAAMGNKIILKTRGGKSISKRNNNKKKTRSHVRVIADPLKCHVILHLFRKYFFTNTSHTLPAARAPGGRWCHSSTLVGNKKRGRWMELFNNNNKKNLPICQIYWSDRSVRVWAAF